MFENKKANGIHYSRYAASWRNVGGPEDRDLFIEWLRRFGLTDDQIADIIELDFCGKMELENDAKKFINLKRNEKLLGA